MRETEIIITVYSKESFLDIDIDESFESALARAIVNRITSSGIKINDMCFQNEPPNEDGFGNIIPGIRKDKISIII